MFPKLLSVSGAALALSLGTLDARATTSCSFSTVVGVAFGTYDIFSALPVDSTGSLTFSCQGVGASDTIIINLSRGNASSYFPRYLLHAATHLTYNLYLDASRSSVWGDGTGGTAHYGPVTPPSGSNVVVPIYGRLPASQTVAAGDYHDTIVVTILF